MKNDQNDEWMMQSWAARFFQEKPEASLLIEMLMFHSFILYFYRRVGELSQEETSFQVSQI